MKKKQIDRDELLYRGLRYVARHDDLPVIDDLKIKAIVFYKFFASLEDYWKELFQGRTPWLRRGKEIRHCRYCNRVLPLYRWFFCPELKRPTLNIKYKDQGSKRSERTWDLSCDEKYARKLEDEDDIHGAMQEISAFDDDAEKVMRSDCKGCAEDCKQMVRPTQDIKITCKKSPDWEETKRKYE
jgi:hypothetical protein